MNVTRDLIAAVTGPGWKYGLSRILIDDEGNGVVFIAGSQAPFASFEVTQVSTSRGRGANADGDITWRRRGSSCQYKLAKCKVNTETMVSWWKDSLAAEKAAAEKAAAAKAEKAEKAAAAKAEKEAKAAAAKEAEELLGSARERSSTVSGFTRRPWKARTRRCRSTATPA